MNLLTSYLHRFCLFFKSKNKHNTVHHEDRPWGFFDQYTLNQKTTVKIIHIKAGQSTSLQYHRYRDERWIVLSGKGRIQIGKNILESEICGIYDVKARQEHRLIGDKNQDLVLLEIVFNYFDENDIVRIEDQYGRIN